MNWTKHIMPSRDNEDTRTEMKEQRMRLKEALEKLADNLKEKSSASSGQ